MVSESILMIHGVGSSFEHNWQSTGWVDMFEAEGRNVIGVELPGHGADPVPPSHDPVDIVLRHCQSVSNKVDAIGFSEGGCVLLRAAARCPDAFRRIAVLGVGDSSDGSDGAMRSRIAQALVSEDDPLEGPARIIRRLAMAAGNDPVAVAGFLRAPHVPLRFADLNMITSPTLVVIGEDDFGGPATRLAAALVSASVVTLGGTDHFATPSSFRCIDAVLDFLSD